MVLKPNEGTHICIVCGSVKERGRTFCSRRCLQEARYRMGKAHKSLAYEKYNLLYKMTMLQFQQEGLLDSSDAIT